MDQTAKFRAVLWFIWRELMRAIENSQLSPEDKAAARASVKDKTFQTRTHGSGNVKNSTFGDHK